MRRDTNRTFYFIETQDENGQDVVRVGSDFAPVWNQKFASLNEAIEAVQRRNAGANFKNLKNGLVVEYSK